MEAGNPASDFWEQTPATYDAIMAGCARRDLRQHGLALATGWYAANFSRAERLKGLDHYLSKLKPQTPQAVAEEAAAMFQGLAARGAPIRIRERRKDT